MPTINQLVRKARTVQTRKPRQPIDLRGTAGGPAPDIEQERAGKDEGGQHQAEGKDSHGTP